MKKIVAPTDFSECAGQGIKVAELIAKKTDSSILFLHTTSIPFDWLNLKDEDQDKIYPDITKKVRKARFSLDELADHTDKTGITNKTFLHYNNGAHHISKFATEQGADLIVMGSHGCKGLKGFFIGSNTQKVVHRASTPVLVVKTLKDKYKIKNIVFASNFKQEALVGFKWLLNFARKIGAKIHMVYINTPFTFLSTDEIMLKIKPFEEEGSDLVKSFEIYNCENFERGLANFSKQKGDLLAMQTKGKNNDHRLYHGNTIEEIFDHLEIPLLCLNIN
ncbi:universal stress protein [Mangrovivirga sp. M17]|uniref:Universal stress protein n=1 Tax=Mangrovivirga halotolerans TaxID=2993936 RepID=A0ABT3RQF8_9BACT|nr:universal stress protein [Mangrovivirga halotolerans]MCX2743817.1 universal stress protein [Mangrovivirga halotolerans]